MAAQSLEGRPKDSGGGAQEHKFVPGGRVQASEGVYIERAADAALLELCIEGKFGIVLQTRQVGKSSLLTRTSEELRRRGTKTALVDLTSIGTKEIAAEQWYLAVLDSICGQVGLAGTFDIVEWWDSLGRLSHVYRFVRFCSDVLVVRLSGRIVVFVDEIDSTLDLDFSDDFFAAIRDIYQTRDRVPGLPRLSFVFAGSSTPDDLMKDEHRTPFNIGVRVEVTDFTLDETLLLCSGFGLSRTQAAPLMERVYFHASGHPYLTQTLCAHVVRDARGQALSPSDVDQAAREHFLGAAGSHDDNLNYVREMLTERAEKIVGPKEVLRVYRDIVRGRKVREDSQSRIHSHLKLSGVVIEGQGGYLYVRNHIYRRVFGRRWLREQLPFDWQQAGKLAASLLVVVLLAAGYFFFVVQKNAKLLADVKASVDRIGSTSDEKIALETYQGSLAPHVAEVREVSKQTPKELLAAFWERRAASLRKRASGADNPDDALLWRALADIKQAHPVDPGVVADFGARYSDATALVAGDRGQISAAVFGDDGRLATGSDDGLIILWRPAGTPPERLSTFWSRVGMVDLRTTAVHYRPDFLGWDARTVGAPMIVAASRAGLVAAFDFAAFDAKREVPEFSIVTTGRQGDVGVGRLEGYHPTVAALSPAGDKLIVAGGALEAFAFPSLKSVTSSEIPAGSQIWDVVFSPRGELLALAGTSSKVEIRDTSLHTIKVLNEDAAVNSVRFSADSRWLLTSVADHSAALWDVKEAKLVTRLKHRESRVDRAEFCKTGHAGSEGGAIGLLTTTHSENRSNVYYWVVSKDGVLIPGKDPVVFSYPGTVIAVSSDCSLIGTVDVQRGGAPLVIRYPGTDWGTETAVQTFMRWERTLRKRVGDVDEIAPLDDLKKLSAPLGSELPL